MTESPLVTVLVTAYNSNPAYLNAAIHSALNQSYPNAEVLVIDDGSEPRLEGVIDEIANPRLRYVHMEHKGLPFGLISGVEAARGKYIAILDHDDMLTEHSLEKRVIAAEEHSCGLVHGDVTLIDKDGKMLFTRNYPDLNGVSEFLGNVIDGIYTVVHHPAVMLSREAVLSVGNYNPDLHAAFDTDIIIRVAERYGVHHVPYPVVNHRIHEGNSSTSYRYIFDVLKWRFGKISEHYHDNKVAWRQLKAAAVAIGRQVKRDLAPNLNYNPFQSRKR